jgi:hypothetical protein
VDSSKLTLSCQTKSRFRYAPQQGQPFDHTAIRVLLLQLPSLEEIMRHFAKGLLAVLITVGCYNARVTTGLAPSGQTFEEEWAPSWIYGGVSPPC